MQTLAANIPTMGSDSEAKAIDVVAKDNYIVAKGNYIASKATYTATMTADSTVIAICITAKAITTPASSFSIAAMAFSTAAKATSTEPVAVTSTARPASSAENGLPISKGFLSLQKIRKYIRYLPMRTPSRVKHDDKNSRSILHHPSNPNFSKVPKLWKS